MQRSFLSPSLAAQRNWNMGSPPGSGSLGGGRGQLTEHEKWSSQLAYILVWNGGLKLENCADVCAHKKGAKTKDLHTIWVIITNVYTNCRIVWNGTYFCNPIKDPSRQKQVYNRRTVRTVLSPTITTTGG